MEHAIHDRAFPGASLAIAHRSKLVALRGFGRYSDASSAEVTPQTVYDLASLTKVIATTTMAMLLFESGKLDVNLPAHSVLPEFAKSDDEKKLVTVRMLLAHTSGLPAYLPLFEKSHHRRELLSSVFQLRLEAAPGARTNYSDLGFIVLGALLETIAGESLASFCQREIFAPLKMDRTAFNPPPEWKASIPPTEDSSSLRLRLIQGEVHDENAHAMGGVAGHAGLFSTAHDIAKFAQCILNAGAPLLKATTVRTFLERHPVSNGTGRALGWDVPTAPSQSGRLFSASSIGHLGFTGTSLWIDPQRQLSVTLLTNRTWPSRANEKIKTVRPQFHDAVIESLEKL